MIFNKDNFGSPDVKAFYVIKKNSFDKYIEIISKDNKRITFTIRDNDFNPQIIEKNKKINLIEYIYWDVELITKETYYLFDITKDKVLLTRLDDNLYNIEVDVKKPDMIYCPLEESFNNLYINADFSFIYKDERSG